VARTSWTSSLSAPFFSSGAGNWEGQKGENKTSLTRANILKQTETLRIIFVSKQSLAETLFLIENPGAIPPGSYVPAALV